MIAMDYLVPRYVVVGVGVTTIFLAVLATTANGLLLFVIYKDPYKCLRRPSTGLIVALSMTDLITGLISDTTYATAVLRGFSDGVVEHGLRTPTLVSGVFTYTSSVILVVALALERVLANGFVAFHRNHVRFKTSLIVASFIWLYGLCFSVFQFSDINEKTYHLADIYLHHAAPIITIMLSYAILYFLIRKHHRAINPGNSNASGGVNTKAGITIQQELQVRRERQLVSVVMVIGLVLFFSLVPYFVVVMLSMSCVTCNHGFLNSAMIVCIPILYFNSVINPYLYAWRLPQYKRSFIAVLPKCI